MPTAPFLLVGQTTAADSSRSPAGPSALAYSTDARSCDDARPRTRARIDRSLERHAPGFLSLVARPRSPTPSDLSAEMPP